MILEQLDEGQIGELGLARRGRRLPRSVRLLQLSAFSADEAPAPIGRTANKWPLRNYFHQFVLPRQISSPTQSIRPARLSLPHIRDDAVGHAPHVLIEGLVAILEPHLQVVVHLPRDEERDIVERVEPRERGVKGGGGDERAGRGPLR